MVKSRRSDVLLRICFKRDTLRMPAIRIGMIAAERRYFHAIHQHHAKLRPHQLSPGKNLEQFRRAARRSRCRNPSVRVPTPDREHNRRSAKLGSCVTASSDAISMAPIRLIRCAP